MDTVASQASLNGMRIEQAFQDDNIGACQLNTLAKIGGALGVKTKRLYDEVEEEGGKE